MTFQCSLDNNQSFCSKFLKQYDSSKHKYNPKKNDGNVFMNNLSKRISNNAVRTQRVNKHRILWKKYDTE